MQKMTVTKIFLTFLKLGLTSFGGPVAHLGYFREEFVARRGCMQEAEYADLVALCQFLPGPASSQVGIGIGISQAGWRGGVAAWCGFTLPSAIMLIIFSSAVIRLEGSALKTGWLHGLKVVAVAVVAQAIWGMGKALCPDWSRRLVALLGALVTLFCSGVFGQLAAILGGAIGGMFFLRAQQTTPHHLYPRVLRKKSAIVSLTLFFILLLVLPLLAKSGGQAIAMIDSFYRAGALVFGGGHVVLPLLQAQVVTPGWIGQDMFLAGYGIAQAVPGPLFTFSAYLGAAMKIAPNGWIGGLLCLLAIFLPSFLLLFGALPFWSELRGNARVKAALGGVNAAVVGLLIAAFYDPVWSRGILSLGDFILALVAFGLLTLWKVPPWAVVAATALGGALQFLVFGG